MKEIIIKLSEREAFVLAQGGIRKIKRRRRFGAIGISKKVGDQLKEQMEKEELDALYSEWNLLKESTPEKNKIEPPKKGKMIIGEF